MLRLSRKAPCFLLRGISHSCSSESRTCLRKIPPTLWKRHLFSSSPKTHYEHLELSHEARPSEIKAAYYSLSKKYHPDRMQQGPVSKKEALDKFLAIKEAYETLSNPEKRVLYDQSIGYTSSLNPSVVFGSARQADFSSWATPSGMPESWRAYQQESQRQKGYAFYTDGRTIDPFASDESYSKSKEEEKKYTFWAITTGSGLCLGGFASLVAYYNLAIDSTPSAMKEANNYHRSRAIILEFNPSDLQRQEEFLGKGKRFEAGPQWIGKKPPEYSLGATR